MAKTNRTKEIWHIPKRGSVHQSIFLVNLLTMDKFLNKSWSSGKQEMIASEMGKAGLTQSGKALSHQSVRTLLANVPKYLGFVFIDETSTPSKIFVTKAGYQLIEQHNLDIIPIHSNLSEYSQFSDLIETSDVFKQQMAKLIITNPIIKNDCERILVFPFRFTLRLLLDLEYLDIEEIAYILFHTKSEDEYELSLKRIENFRGLSNKDRQDEIDAYRYTEEGKLTLVKAPSAGYFMYLCCSTGICKKITVSVNKIKSKKLTALKLKDLDDVNKLLDQFKDSIIYDFNKNVQLWMDYFSDPSIINPPFDIELTTISDKELLVTVSKGKRTISSATLDQRRKFIKFPAFEDFEYQINAYSITNGKKVHSESTKFVPDDPNYIVKIKDDFDDKPIALDQIPTAVQELVDGTFDGFDEIYSKKLRVLRDILGKNYFDNRRKGGRLEYLFFKLFQNLKEKGIIDEVFWFGKESEYGVYEPAPGGRDGSPDLVIEVDNFSVVLELTTIKGIRAQWNSSEASSVPDHIAGYMERHPKRNVIGIFCAPSIHPQLEKNLKLNAKDNNVPMVFEPCFKFAVFLQELSRNDFLNYLDSKAY